MEWFIIEALVALAVGVAIVWWTMAPQKRKARAGDAQSGDAKSGDAKPGAAKTATVPTPKAD
jgi:hypothetical protein